MSSLIGCNGPVRWPAHSMHLTCNCFLWSYLKYIVCHSDEVNDMEELRQWLGQNFKFVCERDLIFTTSS